MKLKQKIHVFSTLLMFIILILANLVIYFLFERMSHDTEYQQLVGRSKELTAALSDLETEMDAGILLRAFVPANGAVSIVDSKNKSLINVQSVEGLGKINDQIKPEQSYLIGSMNGVESLSISVPIIWPTGEVVTLQMTQLLTDVEANKRVLKYVLIGVTIFAMVPIIFSSMTLGKIVTQPIEKLISAMNLNRQSGAYEKMTGNVNGKDELAQMERMFNEMMEQLEQNFRKQEQFVSNASHELKTPLTVIESYTRLLARRGFDNREVVDEALTAVISETGRMKDMIEQMLDLAKSGEAQTVEFTEVNLNQLLEGVVKPLRQAYGREIIIEADRKLIVETDGKFVKQLLFILLDNARKYSEQEIIASIYERENDVEVSIKDYGKGIPHVDLPHIFDRFYRVDSDRSRKTGGTGLGLSIAKEIADGLGATLTIDSVVDKGTVARFFIPKKGKTLRDF
ncbi:HAMP domain-containing sensor histidine kinase [Sporosarcina highlanderae]|uniref:histidine kinase n=1 Tax=Sporosarcina highlanderae TaxID=3035916 RepID=A0ABT8JNR0_9BACL|nr:HAMP domain-containing sensor histidine kinase [Sporosarcina highlanderae]MDN4606196.1 HAMP domain-containing sensor histidine kinase [Sporosarcina highlanderae]